MQGFRVVLRHDSKRDDADCIRNAAKDPVCLTTPNLPISLIVADINLGAEYGCAEIWQQDQRVARLRKKQGYTQAYWELF